MISLLKVIKLSSKVSGEFSISLSDDLSLAVLTDDGVLVLGFEPRSERPRMTAVGGLTGLSHQTRRLPPPTADITGWKVGLDPAKDLRSKHVYDENATDLILDKTLMPSWDQQVPSNAKEYCCTAWSPCGMDESGRCVLATLTVNYQLSIHSRVLGESWETKVASCAQDLHKHWQKEETTKPVSDLNKVYKQRVMQRALVAVCWSTQPEMDELQTEDRAGSDDVTNGVPMCEQNESNGSTKAMTMPDKLLTTCQLAGVTRSGHLAIWKVKRPVSPSACRLVRVIDTNSTEAISCCWCKCAVNMVAIGYTNGSIKVVCVDETCTDFDPLIVWQECDNMPVVHLLWDQAANVLVAVKGCFLVAAQIIVQDGKPVLAAVRHARISSRLPITGFSLRGGKVIMCTSEGHLFSWDIQTPLSSLNFQSLGLLQGHDKNWSHGVSQSPNNAILFQVTSPALYYPGMTQKSPLCINMYHMLNPQQAYSLLSASTLPAHIFDLWLLLGGVFLRDQIFPEKLADLINNVLEGTIDLETLSQTQLQLIRYLLQVSIICSKDKDLCVKENIAAAMVGVDESIMRKYVDTCLEKLDRHHPLQLAAEEEKCIHVMAHFFNKSSKNGQSLEKIGKMFKINSENPAEEICMVCNAVIPFESFKSGICENGHEFGRCCQTLVLCDAANMMVCKSCNSLATVRGPDLSPWMKEILQSKCVLCSTQMHYDI